VQAQRHRQRASRAPLNITFRRPQLLQPRTLKILGTLLSGYALLVFSAYWGPAYLEAMGSYFVMVPLLSIYVFHKLGIPGLLEHNGACGWGWCSPTPFGWAFLVLFWIGVAWLIAWGLARLTARSKANVP
jgi:hypothetical protein